MVNQSLEVLRKGSNFVVVTTNAFLKFLAFFGLYDISLYTLPMNLAVFTFSTFKLYSFDMYCLISGFDRF